MAPNDLGRAIFWISAGLTKHFLGWGAAAQLAIVFRPTSPPPQYAINVGAGMQCWQSGFGGGLSRGVVLA